MNSMLVKVLSLSLQNLLIYSGVLQFVLFFCALIFFVQPQFLIRMKSEWLKSFFSVIGIIFLILNFAWATVCGALYHLYISSGLSG